MANLAPEEKKTEYITKKKTKRKAGPASGLEKKEGKIKIIMVGEDGKMLDQPMFEKFSKGGRVNLRGGGCAKRGVKKNAYGKNS